MYEQGTSTLLHPALCEVNYHQVPRSDGDTWDDVYTPYRYRGLSSHTSHIGYEPTTVGCRTPQAYGSPYRANTTLSLYSTQGGSAIHAERSGSYYHQGTQYTDNNQYGPKKRGRVKTAPIGTGGAALLPVLFGHGPGQDGGPRAWTQGGHPEQSPGYGGMEDRVKWVPALNTWMSVKESQNPVPYMSFVNTANLGDRGFGQSIGLHTKELPILPCSRFLSHMSMHEDTLRALYAQKNAKLQNQKSKNDRRTIEPLSQRANSLPVHKPSSRVTVDKPVPPRPTKHPPGSQPAPRDHTPTSITPPKTKTPSPPRHISPPPLVEVDDESDEDKDTEADGDGNRADEEVDPLDIWTAQVEPLPELSPFPTRSPSPIAPEPLPPVVIPGAHSDSRSSQKASRSPVVGKPPKTKDQATQVRKPKGNKTKDAATSTSKKKKLKDNTGARKTEISKVDLEEPPSLQLNIKSEKETTTDTDSSNQIQNNPLNKHVRWRAQTQTKSKADESSTDTDAYKRSGGGWLYGEDDFSTTMVQKESEEQESASQDVITVTPPTPRTPSPTPSSESTSKRSQPNKMAPEWANQRWGLKKRDISWEEEQRKKMLAQERRDKAQLMYDRLRKKRYKDEDDTDLSGGPNFEEYGWLAKYCIFQRGSLEMFKHIFDSIDEDDKGYLGPLDTIIALRTINNRLSLTEEEYVYRILELVGYTVTAGADFKLFAVLAALSQRIMALDDWMKHLIGNMDFGTLDRKMFMCKRLWECNVDPDTNKISIDQLCVELRAGGVSYEHELEVRDKLCHLNALDLIDFMTYIPLFIMIHESVLTNPLDDSRAK